MARFVGMLVSLRRKYQDLLQPLSFASDERDFRWHGAYEGAGHHLACPTILALEPFAGSVLAAVATTSCHADKRQQSISRFSQHSVI